MRTGKLILAVLLAALLCCFDCGCEQEGSSAESAAANPLAAVSELTAAACADLQPGESTALDVTPELIKAFWDTARMDLWFHLPEFAEGEQPTDVASYWFLVLTDDVTGLDEYGYWVREQRWEENTSDTYGMPGAAVIPKEEVDKFVHTHFGDVQLEHSGSEHKMFDFDGENYYDTPEGSFPVGYYGLTELAAERREDGRLVYTAVLNDYVIGYDEGEAAVEAAYGEQIANNELTFDQAATQMVLDGQTADFPVDGQLKVTFYIDESGETVYLAAGYEPTEHYWEKHAS